MFHLPPLLLFLANQEILKFFFFLRNLEISKAKFGHFVYLGHRATSKAAPKAPDKKRQVRSTVVVQSLNSCLTPHDPMDCSSPGFLGPSQSPGVYSDSWSLSQWFYLTISSSATLFSFCLQSFSASGSFPMSQLFTSDGQSIGASASVLPMNI